MKVTCLIPILAAAVAPLALAAEETPLNKAVLAPFLKEHCVRCHGPEKQKGKLRLDGYDFAISDKDEALRYQDVLDVLNSGEMPPEDEPQPSKAAMEAAIGELTSGLFEARKRLVSTGGSVTMRRLNRREYGATIRHLFGFEPPATRIPTDDGVENFDTVGTRQHFTTEHLDHYYELAQEILTAGFKWAGVREEVKTSVQQPEVFCNDGFRRSLEEWKNADKSSGKIKALTKMRLDYFKLPKFETGVYLAEPVRHLTYKRGIDPRGSYRIRILAGIEGEVLPIRRFIKVGLGSDQTAGVFRIDGTTEKPTESVLEVRPALLGGALSGYVREDRSGAWLSHYLKSLEKYEGVDREREGLIWIDSIAMEGPFYPPQRSFFDRLLCPAEPAPGKTSPMVWNDANARELIARFTSEAFRRRKVDAVFVDGLATHFKKQREKGAAFEEAMVNTLAVVLASPGFVFLNEEANAQADARKVTPRDAAIRLSYFLTSGPPDEALYKASESGGMSDRVAFHREVERLLSGTNQRLAEGFGGQWADFVRFDGITLSKEFPTFNEGLRHSSKQEVIAYFRALIAGNRPVSQLIQSDFATINAQLATHYGIPGVTSNEFVTVKLPPGSHRGGFLGQAAFLTAGSNGERTSPTVRGMLLLNRFFNAPPPPPPPNVPELGSGATGAVTNRKLVELHQSQVQCASCHRKMDTIGLALENFDVIGRWREAETTAPGKTEPVAIHGALPGGERFTDFQQFQTMLMKHQDRLARNMIESLLVYALGRDIEFTDQPHIDKIMAQLQPTGFRLKDMIHAIAESPFFFTN